MHRVHTYWIFRDRIKNCPYLNEWLAWVEVRVGIGADFIGGPESDLRVAKFARLLNLGLDEILVDILCTLFLVKGPFCPDSVLFTYAAYAAQVLSVRTFLTDIFRCFVTAECLTKLYTLLKPQIWQILPLNLLNPDKAAKCVQSGQPVQVSVPNSWRKITHGLWWIVSPLFDGLRVL